MGKNYTVFALALLSLPLAAEDFQGSDHPLEYDQEPIKYSETQPNDPVAALQAKILSGEVSLGWDDKFGYLPAVLDAFKVPRASQMLVFSKSSLQRKNISPDNPRAIFFNDDVYIGYVPGAPLMEISAVDPLLGGTFYSAQIDMPVLYEEPEIISGESGSDGINLYKVKAHGADDGTNGIIPVIVNSLAALP